MLAVLTIPRTTTFSPVTMALAEVESLPFWYVVEDVSTTVTFWPAAVVTVKPVVDTLSTTPDVPPSAGADRAGDAPASPKGNLADAPASAVVEEDMPDAPASAVAEGDDPDAPASVVAEGDMPDAPASAVAGEDEEDEEQPAEGPIAADISAAAAIHPPFPFGTDRRGMGRRARLVIEADESGEAAGGGVGAALPLSKPPAPVGPGVAREMLRARRHS